ncbi:RagB/SusD family nutrient uptake outer membrane protein [Aurantibacter crassamenti]|uniref:RagB/SusD family nutrient uptake outer membrane protein n=1 Tax=Aurantibacter crassamenti TaxID=1837375 RepID=UPI0019392765|nr:RagB/SusD family nutrient uptake outer membrane protein [Aurantibacter crassamenti]MBM1105804.1 RagB/SusD family nutrient uptake outer membrane protein [Aurantibacter crassamenti]
MKKYKYITAIVFSLLFINSCDDSGLELINENNIAPETFFADQKQVEASVTAIYANLQTQGLYTRHMFFMMDNMSHENAGNPQLEADKREYLDFAFNSAHGAIGQYWTSCYKGINKANFVISNQEKINELSDNLLSQELKNKYIGEAKFMRALYYFFLVTRYGDVPLITEIPVDNVGNPRSPKEDVYQQIITDLTDASNTLLAKGVEVKGRATKETALAFLGKVHLFRGEHQLALTNFEKIYNKYSLEDNYFDNFRADTEYGEESIFEVAYDEAIGGSGWGDGVSGDRLNEITFRGQEYGFNDWFNVYPSDDLVNEYEVDDPRLNDVFYSEGAVFPGGTIKSGTPPEEVPEGEVYIPLNRTHVWKKYQNYYQRDHENQASGINFKVLRYADVLLMMAECENEVGTQAKAVGYINEVRARPSVSMPALSTGLSKPAVFDAIVHERKVELAGEQIRFNDLIRWGKAAEFLAGTGFQAGKSELFPIPLSEITANENISSSDQNPGY